MTSNSDRHEVTDHRGESGQGLAEFAMILPVLVLILMTVFDFGCAVYAYSVVNSAAREGARYALAHPSNSSAIITWVEDSTAGLDPTALEVVVSHPDSTSIRVQVRYTFEPITPLIASIISDDGELVLSSTATMYTEY